MDKLLPPGMVRSEAAESHLFAGRCLCSLPTRRGLRILALGLLLAVLAGCSQPAEPMNPPEQEVRPERESASSPAVTDTTATTEIALLPENAEVLSLSETWHANYMQGNKIGYRQTQVRELQVGDKRMTLTNVLEKQSMLRFGQELKLEIRGNQLQDADGNIQQFSYQLPADLGIPSKLGFISGETAILARLSPAKEAKDGAERIAFPAGTRGFDGVEQALLDSPMKPGETRSFKMLQIPPLQLISEVKLQAVERTKTSLPAGEVELLLIEQQVALPGGAEMLVELWTDDNGEVLKYAIPQMQQESYLTTKELALDETDAFSFDIGTDTLIRLQDPPDDPHHAQRQSYQLTWNKKLKGAELLNLITADSLSQEVWTLEHVMLHVTVRAIRPDQPAELEKEQPQPTEAVRQASSLVQSNDPEIMKLAESATQGTESDWEKAVALEKFVNEYLTEKNYSQAFASAADVAKSREGDCTEHAVLLAALCRAEKIPARVAFGLVYVEGEQAFAFHMWNEVWIQDRWIPLDATLALGGIGAGHLLMGTSPLGDMSALLDLLPVMQAIGKLEIQAIPGDGQEIRKESAGTM